METIFDHNITKEELDELFGPLDWTKEFFEAHSQEDNYIDLYRLFRFRGDLITAQKYLNKIKDKDYKLFSLCHRDF